MFKFRENGGTGDIFTIVFGDQAKHLFSLSAISVGAGVIIIKPQLEGYWCQLPLITSGEPLLPGETNWERTPAVTFPDNV